MKILTAEQMRDWDQYTILHEPIPSIGLMERAAMACTEWLELNEMTGAPVCICCGKGNNGGDGLAIARQLAERQVPVHVCILEFGHRGTDDFQINLARLHQYPQIGIRFIQSADHIPAFTEYGIIIDALYGSGLNRAIEGVTASLIEAINGSGKTIVAIDLPSGMFADHSSAGNPIVKAAYTLSFQTWKPAFMHAENGPYLGRIEILDIGLHQAFYETTDHPFSLTDDGDIRQLYIPRDPWGHKGNFGHAFLLAGSYGKIGAAVLAAKACLRAGTGLLTCQVPSSGYAVMQSVVPEAMVITDPDPNQLTKTDGFFSKYASIGIGPGIGTDTATMRMMQELFSSVNVPMVIDADALNIIAASADMLARIPKGSILTPHPKEFERLFGKCSDDFKRVEMARQQADALQVTIILKGHHSFIAGPGQKGTFNGTGNAGMATGGSGDVLTGILTGLLAQGYTAHDAAVLGTWLHGLAGDLAAKELSQEGMTAGDIIAYLPQAWLQIKDL